MRQSQRCPHITDGRNEVPMVTQRKVLTFIAAQATTGSAVTVSDIAGEFWLSAEAAAGHIRRLWGERLIEAVLPRARSFRFKLESGEAVASIRFRLAARGRQRIRWYDRQDKAQEGFGLFS
jgi:hypothetical protein